MKKLVIWTLIVLLALIFYYSFKVNAIRSVAIIGDEEFKRDVMRGLTAAGLRFSLRESGTVDAVFDQRRKICEVNGKIYHLDWKEEVRFAVERKFGFGVEMVPVVRGKRGWWRVFEDCGRIIKGKGTTVFQNGWLIVRAMVLVKDEIVGTVDPVSGSIEVMEGSNHSLPGQAPSDTPSEDLGTLPTP